MQGYLAHQVPAAPFWCKSISIGVCIHERTAFHFSIQATYKRAQPVASPAFVMWGLPSLQASIDRSALAILAFDKTAVRWAYTDNSRLFPTALLPLFLCECGWGVGIVQLMALTPQPAILTLPQITAPANFGPWEGPDHLSDVLGTGKQVNEVLV